MTILHRFREVEIYSRNRILREEFRLQKYLEQFEIKDGYIMISEYDEKVINDLVKYIEELKLRYQNHKKALEFCAI